MKLDCGCALTPECFEMEAGIIGTGLAQKLCGAHASDPFLMMSDGTYRRLGVLKASGAIGARPSFVDLVDPYALHP